VRASLLLFFWGAMLSPCRSEEPVFLGDIEIVIDRTTKPDAVVWSRPLGVHKKAEEVFGDLTLGWDPMEYLKESQLRCVQDEKTTLSIGGDAKSDLILSVSSDDKIRKGKDVTLSFQVSRPDMLVPGIYRGMLKFRFSAPGQLNEDVTGELRITVAVRGRRLMDLAFIEAKNGQMRFGSPADLEVTIDTIDCDLGKGALEFSHQPAIAPAPQKLSPLQIPFADNEFVDPKVALKESTYPQAWSKTAFWTEAGTAEPPSPAKNCEWKRHSVKLHLGDCDDLGRVQGRIEWPQAGIAPGSREPLKRSVEAKILEGISITPRIAFQNEHITLTLASIENLGPKIRAVLMDDKKMPHPIELTRQDDERKGTGGKKSGEKPVRVDGQPYLYSKTFVERSHATFAVTFPEDVVVEHPSLKDLNDVKNTVRVWMRTDNTTARSPMRVFASSTPFWWGMLSDPFKGKGWTEERPAMWTFEFDSGRMHEVSLMLSPMSNRPISVQGIESSPEYDPALNNSGPPSEDIDGVKVWNEIQSPLELTGKVSFQNRSAVEKRPVIGSWKFPYRIRVRGTSDGIPVVRIFESTILVEVTTEWVYYRQIIGWVIGAVALLILMYWMYRRANPKLRSTSDPAAPVPGIQRSSEDDLGDFVSGQPSREQLREAPALPPETGAPPPSSEPPRNDDIEDWA
jgi:hypothetical protein